ncbi:cation diffusion facilitator family transporter, partial [Cardiobacterium hominis]|uniref:cation diffusion facilitator family transporter n=1 Tax=Cardiobacterium hominis TaxID=2718 RepID=UPI0028EAC7A0
MSHVHTHNKTVLKYSLLLIAAFMLVEIAGGLLTNSLALLSDAGHMLSDAIALGLSLAAFHWSDRPTTLKNTFGYRRGEIIAAALNGLTLAAIVLWIVIEAIGRLLHPPEVASIGMLAVAVIGLAVNILIAVWMHRGGDIHGNLNMKSAYLHVLGDLLGSVGAILAAVLMMAFGWRWADPLVSLFIAALIGKSSIGVLKSALHILMEGAPAHIDHDRLLATLRAHEAVISVHDLHLWTITSGLNALSCHIVVAGEMR